MGIRKRLALLASPALAILFAASCTRIMAERPTGFPDTSLPRWDAPDYLAKTPHNPDRQRPDKLALDHTGRRLAFAVPGLPSQGLLVLDLVTGTVVVLNNAIPSIEYVEPGFSRDGERLVFLATPVPRFGWSEIWIASPNGQYETRLPGCNARHRAPTFSPDGAHIAYYRGLDERDSTQWRSAMWPEQRGAMTLQAYGIFELALSDNRQRQIAGLAYHSPSWIEYADNDTLMIGATGLLGRRDGDSPLAWIPALDASVRTALDHLPGAKALIRQPNQTHLIRDIHATGPVISPAYRTGPPEEPAIISAPAGRPVTTETERMPEGAARSFEHALHFVGAETGPPLFDTRTAPGFALHDDQMIGVSGDLCTIAYWGQLNGQVTVSTRNRCSTESHPDQTHLVSDLVGRARVAQSPWRFGEACEPSPPG